jgi:hypothetical protein
MSRYHAINRPKDTVISTFAELLFNDSTNNDLVIRMIYDTHYLGKAMKEYQETGEFDTSNYFDNLIEIQWKEAEDSSWFGEKLNVKKDKVILQTKDSWDWNENGYGARFMERSYMLFNDMTEYLFEYYVKGEDKYYVFRNKGISEETKGLFYTKFKNEIFSKASNKEDFTAKLKEVIEKKVKKILVKEYHILPHELDESRQVYLLPEDFDIQEMITKNTFPKVTAYRFKEKRIKGINEVAYYFVRGKYAMEEKLENLSKSEYLRFTDQFRGAEDKKIYDRKMIDCIIENNVKLFTSKEEAEGFYKGRLKEVRNKINKILNNKFDF